MLPVTKLWCGGLKQRWRLDPHTQPGGLMHVFMYGEVVIAVSGTLCTARLWPSLVLRSPGGFNDGGSHMQAAVASCLAKHSVLLPPSPPPLHIFQWYMEQGFTKHRLARPRADGKNKTNRAHAHMVQWSEDPFFGRSRARFRVPPWVLNTIARDHLA